jgi:hypothetical protein
MKTYVRDSGLYTGDTSTGRFFPHFEQTISILFVICILTILLKTGSLPKGAGAFPRLAHNPPLGLRHPKNCIAR